MPKGKKLDLLVVIFLNVLAGVYSYLTQGTFVGSFLIGGAVAQFPVILYLSLRDKKNWKKIIIAVIVFDILFESFDFIAEYTRAWTVTSLVFPVKLFGVLPLDNILGHMSIVLYTIVFYDHFLNKPSKKISKNVKYPLVIGFIFIILAALVYFYNPDLMRIKYPFLILGTLAIIPAIKLAYLRPSVFFKMSIAGIYFFFYYLSIELMANAYKYWIYTGNNYVGWVSFFGLTFPFEEFFFWVIFYGPTIIAYYELWIDDQK